MPSRILFQFVLLFVVVFELSAGCEQVTGQQGPDYLRQMQFNAVSEKQADWVHWGDRADVFSTWTNHSNRLIPVYTFGMNLDAFQNENSVYRSKAALTELYGKLPTATFNPQAEYFDQSDIFRLQKLAFESGKKHVILIVFDGMDWQTSQAASVYKHKRVLYTQGRGSGLSFLDYDRAETDFGYVVTSPHNNDTKTDLDAQLVTQIGGEERIGGYSAELGGAHPWSEPGDPSYLLGKRKTEPHMYTDSAASATSMTTGFKTFNAAINVGPDGEKLETIAHQMQGKGYSIGVVTSVPLCHATPACAYAHNVTRNDYQDLARDLLGIKSAAHTDEALPGVDVLIGCGWGEEKDDDRAKQGRNYIPGNKFLCESDFEQVDLEHGGKYVVARRTAGNNGRELLMTAAEQAVEKKSRLLGFFGVGGHLPFQTADGNYDPTRGIKAAERYSEEDLEENPTLADMTVAALRVLETNDTGFWLMIECGDVDWASHDNNIDDAIGAVFSGEAAFDVVTKWVETNSSWDETAVIVTADHGHMLVVEDLEALTGKRSISPVQERATADAGQSSEEPK